MLGADVTDDRITEFENEIAPIVAMRSANGLL